MKNIFPKRNELVSLKGTDLSIYARKTLDYIYKEGIRVYEQDKYFGIFELDLNLLKKEIGMNRTSDYAQIKNELEKINKLEFETYDDKHYSKFPVIAGFNIKENGILETALSPFLIRMIFDKENPYYHLVDFMEYKPLRSKYSKLILDLHYRYKDIGIPFMKIDKFQDIMQYSNKYRNNDIQKFVLEQAKKELEKYNNLELTWDIQKIGRKWSTIKLNIKDKSMIDIVPELHLSSKLLKAIEKVLKNRFIEKSYSQKSMDIILKQYEEKDIIKALGELYKYNSEVKSFSKILISKIEDIKYSKITKIKEKQQNTLSQPKIETPLKFPLREINNYTLDLEKERISILIKNTGLPTNKRLFLMGQLAEINNFEDLEVFKKEIELLN